MINGFFVSKLSKLVERGHLYRAMTPLYQVKMGNDELFVQNKTEFHKLALNTINDKLEIRTKEGLLLTFNDIISLLNKNEDYLYEIDLISKSLSVDIDVLEYFLYFYLKYDGSFNKVKEKMEKKFRFISLEKDEDGLFLNGTHNDEWQSFIVDEIFFETVSSIIYYIKEVNSLQLEYKINGKNCLLSDILLAVDKYHPKILARYKGLAELSPQELKQTTLQNKRLIRLTVEDLEKEMVRFNIMHGSDIASRKSMMKNYKVLRDEIDT